MKSFKLLANLFASFCLIVGSSTAHAENPVSVSMLNYTKSVENMEKELKDFFPTKEDHRQIELEFAKVRGVADKWLWRYEKSGNGVAFRLNGRVQFTVEADPADEEGLLLNGKKVSMKKGQSFRTFYTNAMNIINGRNANLDFLFIDEAEAGLLGAIIIGGLIFAGASMLATRVFGASRRCNPKGAKASPPFTRSEVSTAAKHFKRSCNGNKVNVNNKWYRCNEWENEADCVNFKVENGAFGKTEKNCASRASRNTRSGEGDATGNEWDLVPGGTSGKDITTPVPTPRPSDDDCRGKIQRLCAAAYSMSNHCTGEPKSRRTEGPTRRPRVNGRRSPTCRVAHRGTNPAIKFTSGQMITSSHRWKGNSCRKRGRVGRQRVNYNTNGCFHNRASCVHWKWHHREARKHNWGKLRSEADAVAVCDELQRYVNCKRGSGPDNNTTTETPNDWDLVPSGTPTNK